MQTFIQPLLPKDIEAILNEFFVEGDIDALVPHPDHKHLAYLPSFYVKIIVGRLDPIWIEILKTYSTAFVTGSFCLASLDNMEWAPNDIDIFIGDKREYAACKTKYFEKSKTVEDDYGHAHVRITNIERKGACGEKAQLVLSSISDMLEFDFTITCLGVLYNADTGFFEGVCHERFLRDYSARKLMPLRPEPSNNLLSFFSKEFHRAKGRRAKYEARGFK